MAGDILPVVITVYVDKRFTFITKKPPVAELLKKAVGVEKGQLFQTAIKSLKSPDTSAQDCRRKNSRYEC